MKEHIYCVITTKKPEDWKEMKPKIQKQFKRDISDFVPLFLTLKDFDITHDPDFKVWSMISSWWQYKKLPILLINNRSDLQGISETSRVSLELNSIYVD